ncbi:MAG TPA: hypothetical protein VKP30_14320 [Polyangiaceae bacterium]|nr:hypothetical protein [Polyangiaceae bacterium]
MQTLTLSNRATLRANYDARRAAHRALVERLAVSVPSQNLHRWARDLGFWEDGKPSLEDPHQLRLLMDFAVHDQLSCGKLDFGNLCGDADSNADPIQSDVISAMRHTRFTILHVQEVIGDLGAWVDDLFYGERYLVCDIGLGSEANIGRGLATRVLMFPDFVMTTGAPIGVPPTLVNLLSGTPDGEQSGGIKAAMCNYPPQTLRMLAIQITRAAFSRSAQQGGLVRQ